MNQGLLVCFELFYSFVELFVQLNSFSFFSGWTDSTRFEFLLLFGEFEKILVESLDLDCIDGVALDHQVRELSQGLLGLIML